MKVINLIRGYINKYVKQFGFILKPLIKFVGFFAAFRIISTLPFFKAEGLLNSPLVSLVLAGICIFLPNRFGVLLAFLLASYNAIKTSLFGGIIIMIFLLAILIIADRFTPEYSYFLLLIPIALHFKLYLLVPLAAGLWVGAAAILPVAFGTIVYGLYNIAPAMMALENGELSLSELPKLLTAAADKGLSEISSNSVIIFLLITFAVVTLLVALFSKMQFDYVRYIALALGTFLGVICLLICRSSFDLKESVGGILLGGFVSLIVVAVLEFIHLPLNFTGAEILTFEDDTSFYQVRVTPKAVVPKTNRKKKAAPAEQETPTENRDEGWLLDDYKKPEPAPELNSDTMVPGQSDWVRVEDATRTLEKPEIPEPTETPEPAPELRLENFFED